MRAYRIPIWFDKARGHEPTNSGRPFIKGLNFYIGRIHSGATLRTLIGSIGPDRAAACVCLYDQLCQLTATLDRQVRGWILTQRQGAADAAYISAQIGMPTDWVERTLADLVDAGWIVRDELGAVHGQLTVADDDEDARNSEGGRLLADGEPTASRSEGVENHTASQKPAEGEPTADQRLAESEPTASRRNGAIHTASRRLADGRRKLATGEGEGEGEGEEAGAGAGAGEEAGEEAGAGGGAGCGVAVARAVPRAVAKAGAGAKARAGAGAGAGAGNQPVGEQRQTAAGRELRVHALLARIDADHAMRWEFVRSELSVEQIEAAVLDVLSDPNVRSPPAVFRTKVEELYGYVKPRPAARKGDG